MPRHMEKKIVTCVYFLVQFLVLALEQGQSLDSIMPTHTQIHTLAPDFHLSTTVPSNDAEEKKLADHCTLLLTESLR